MSRLVILFFLLVIAQVPSCIETSQINSELGPDSKPLRVIVEHISANTSGLTYGWTAKEDGKSGNSILSLSGVITAVGYRIELENLSSFPLFFEWGNSAIIDSLGWSHALLDPDTLSKSLRWPEHSLMVAPNARRLIQLVPQCEDGVSLYLPKDQQSWRPTWKTIDPEKFSERLFLCFRCRDDVLYYNLLIRVRQADPPPNTHDSASLSQ